MASAGTLRNAYIEITDRLRNDTDFRNYFAQFDLEKETKQIQHPFCRVALANFTTEPSRVTKTEQPSFIFGVTIEIKCRDEEKKAIEMLNAIEVFVNAYFGTDPTFNNKVLKSEIIFDDFEQKDRNSVVTFGEIEILLQQYQQGGL